MEQTNLAKKIWNIVRAVCILLRKGISKGKLMADLNAILTRGKIAGKAFHNLMFHNVHNHSPHHVSFSGPREYEFSCSNSPTTFFHINKHGKKNHVNFFGCAHAPRTNDDVATVNAIRKALEMLTPDVAASPAFWQSPMVRDLVYSEMSSPALPGFGPSPAPVRKLRITDSPFPLLDVDENCNVDKAAEEFISKFYSELRRQNKKGFR